MSSSRRLAVPTLLAVSLLTLTACGEGETGSDPASESPAASENGALSIVTSTNVYGEIASAVGGEDVEVTSIVNSLSQDPHSYEATVQDKLAVSEADLVIENGGGYDVFLERLAEETGVTTVLSAVELSGLEGAEEATDEHAGEEEHAEEEHAEEGEHAEEEHAEEGEPAEEEGHGHGSFNEHVWYDVASMMKLADSIAEELAGLDEANAEAYRERAAAFTEDLQPIQDRLDALAADGPGGNVAVTEPVPVYLLEDAGFENVTPEEFTEAIEEESDVPVAALEEMTTLVSDGSLAFLAYNGQTEGPQTQAVREAADEAGLPIVDFTETVPDGEDYVSWMESNVDNIEAALGS